MHNLFQVFINLQLFLKFKFDLQEHASMVVRTLGLYYGFLKGVNKYFKSKCIQKVGRTNEPQDIPRYDIVLPEL